MFFKILLFEEGLEKPILVTLKLQPFLLKHLLSTQKKIKEFQTTYYNVNFICISLNNNSFFFSGEKMLISAELRVRHDFYIF